MGKDKSSDYDVYMARLRQSEERPINKLNPEEKRLVNFVKQVPSFNEIFKKKKKHS